MKKINWNELQKEFEAGSIIICPICDRVDIDPLEHKNNCDYFAEQDRKLAQDYYD